MHNRNAMPKYKDMEANFDHNGFDVKKSAHKVVEKTQRTLHKPIHQFVHQPRDENLIEENSSELSHNIENDGYHDNLPQSDDYFSTVRSHSDVVHYESRKPAKVNHVVKNVTQKETAPIVLYKVPVSNRSTPNIDIMLKDKRTNAYRDPIYFNEKPVIEENNFSRQKPNNSSLINVDGQKLPSNGAKLSFHNIIYTVFTKKFPWSKSVSKTILDNVSGIMLPGVNAIMGPTGCGKSSILDVLAGRKDPRFLKGEVLINGLPQPKYFKCISGYVVQDDIVMGTLTVKENLMFSAALRLPMNYSQKYRIEKVEKIIVDLGLSAVANSKIGTEMLRGVSGGERKRCNIGMELITDPDVLFLDEPTTGLDAFTAASVITTLRELSRRGKTIVLSIHQPKYSIYKLFDRYTLMAKGKILYHGKAGSFPLSYFDNLGYRIEPHNNPSDFYIDIINGEVKNEREVNQQVVRQKSDLVDKKDIINQLVNEWKNSNNNKELKSQLRSNIIDPKDEIKITGKTSSVYYSTNWFNQLKWVCWRTGLDLLRNPQTSVIQLGVYLFFAFSMGVVYFGLTTQSNRGYQDRYGLFFFASLQVIFVNLGAIEIFIKERPIFIHENSSGYYRVSSYFFAKLLCDMVPIKVLPAVVFLPITYFMSQLRADAGAFFFFELILLLTTSAGCSIAFFVSSSFSIFGLANVITPIIYVFMMVFSGYLISIDSIFPWLNWCRYISAFRYAIAGLSVNELKGQQFCQNVSVSCMSANQFLDQNSILYSTTWDLWVNPLGLFLITLVFLCLCYIQLRRINKYK